MYEGNLLNFTTLLSMLQCFGRTQAVCCSVEPTKAHQCSPLAATLVGFERKLKNELPNKSSFLQMRIVDIFASLVFILQADFEGNIHSFPPENRNLHTVKQHPQLVLICGCLQAEENWLSSALFTRHFMGKRQCHGHAMTLPPVKVCTGKVGSKPKKAKQ